MNIRNLSNTLIRNGLLVFGLCLHSSSLTVAAAQEPAPLFAQRQRPPRLRPGNQNPLNRMRREMQARHKQIDPQAVRLLQRMIRTQEPYSGEQITEVAERGMQSSRLRVWGMRGRVRRDYLSPPTLAGDIMITGPQQYRYFHRRRNVLDIALWPTPWNARDERMFNLIRSGGLSVQTVGEETIAGRNAAIVLVSPAGASDSLGRQMKFWIDRETGIQLKNEISSGGNFVSRSYMKTIAVGPEANVNAKLFDPPFLNNARPNPLFPPTSQFANLEEAKDRLPFAPLQPESLPEGFRLSGVWIFGPENGARPASGGTILLRYSDGVGSFSLFQRRVNSAERPLAQRPTPPLRRSIQHWRISTENGQMGIIYIGSLAPEQIRAIYDSLR